MPIFTIGELVYYHKKSFVKTACYVLSIEDNGYAVWIRFAEKIDGMVVDKLVSCYDILKSE